jgi:hypothetical protein
VSRSDWAFLQLCLLEGKAEKVQAWAGGHLLHEVEPVRAAEWVLRHLRDVPDVCQGEP